MGISLTHLVIIVDNLNIQALKFLLERAKFDLVFFFSVRLEMQRVEEWIQRKANHAPDPLLENLQESGSKALGNSLESSSDVFVASFNGREIAKTRRAQIVNQRVYFPFEDVSKKHLSSSSKRWR